MTPLLRPTRSTRSLARDFSNSILLIYPPPGGIGASANSLRLPNDLKALGHHCFCALSAYSPGGELISVSNSNSLIQGSVPGHRGRFFLQIREECQKNEEGAKENCS